MFKSADHPLSAYLERLSARGGLNKADREAFFSLRAHVEIHTAGARIVCQGDPTEDCIFLIDGFLSRTKIISGGQSILGFCLPGDAVELHSLFSHDADCLVQAHASSIIAKVGRSDLAALMVAHPNIMKALWLDAHCEAMISREWTVNLGARSARQRLAHLLLELQCRYRRSAGEPFPLPVKQGALASAVGLSLVHLNKSLQWLRREGFVVVKERTFRILNHDDLVAFCEFDPSYLQPYVVTNPIDELARSSLKIVSG